MLKLLIMTFLLNDIVGITSRGYDYEELEDRKHHGGERLFRRKSLLKSAERTWDKRQYEAPQNPLRYYDEVESKNYVQDRQGDPEFQPRHYDDIEKLQKAIKSPKSGEMDHSPPMEEMPEKKKSPVMNCDRLHERYEPCFAGCAAVTCDNPRDRLRPCYPFCEPGCVCIHPYVRDDRTHKCIIVEECTKGLKGIPDLGDER